MDDDEDEQLLALISSLDTAATAEKRLTALIAIKDHISTSDDITSADHLIPVLRAQLKNQNHLVSSLALTIVPTYASQLVKSNNNAKVHDVKLLLNVTLPLVLERLGDHKEKVRELARIAIIELTRAAFAVSGSTSASLKEPNSAVSLFEKLYKDGGLSAKSAKIKEQATLVLIPLRGAIDRLQLKPFLPSLVEQLSDADPAVREAARMTCINLFSSASATAKSELKKEMERKSVRKQTADAILAQVLGVGSLSVVNDFSADNHASSNALIEEEAPKILPSKIVSGNATSEQSSDSGIPAVYIASQWDLERTFQAMSPHFEGKETEHNWLAREQSVIKLRGMLKTGVHESLYEGFLQGLKLLQEGILKATASLRTTLSIHALQLISEVARNIREGIDSIAEPLLSSIIKMAGFTKKIVASASQAAVRDIIVNVSYRHKFLDCIWQHLQEKTVTTRAFMCDHFIAILNSHAIQKRHQVEAHGGLDIIERFCKKSLPDQTKDVREKAREAFYLIETIWPLLAAQILNSLDAATRKQVEVNRGTAPSWEPSASKQNHFAKIGSPAAVKVAAPMTPRRAAVAAGPSSVIVAAKRAAAARLAQERKEKEEAEVISPLHDEVDTINGNFEPLESREDFERRQLEEFQAMKAKRSIVPTRKEVDSSSIKESPVSFPSPPSPKSPLRSGSLFNGRVQKRTTSPSAIPLPVSPRSSARLPFEDSRKLKSSSVSQATHFASTLNASEGRARNESTSSTSSARSLAKSGVTANSVRYDSFGQRVNQTSHASVRSRSSSTSSSSAQQKLSSPPSSPSRERAISTTSSFHNFDQLTQNEDGDAILPTGELRNDFRGIDVDTANNAGDPGRKKRSSTSSQLSGLSTSSSPRMNQSLSETPASPTKSSSSSGRSRLPRPVSMLIANQAIAAPVLANDNNISETSASTTAAIAPLAIDKNIETQDASAGTNKMPLNKKKISSSSAAVKWFLGKASRLDHADEDSDREGQESLDIQLSPVKRRPESETFIGQLQACQADVRTFKGLAKLCKDYRLPDCDGDGVDENEVMLQPGRYEDTRSALDVPINFSRREQEIAVTMWQQGNLFERLYEAISVYLCSDSIIASNSKDLQTAALIVLHRLVENQFRLFEVQHKEGELLQLLFELIKKSNASSVKSACQAIMESWSEQSNVVVGISTLRGILSIYLGDTGDTAAGTEIISIHTLALQSLSRLFQRLPLEIVEDEVQQCKVILKVGLNHWNIETRQQAVSVLVTANSKIDDPKKLFSILQPMERSQEDLLMYYMSKN